MLPCPSLAHPDKLLEIGDYGQVIYTLAARPVFGVHSISQ
jgi:hypothetical protein